ncbi:MAG: hypothetical protein ACJ07L_18600 [Opitutales bacterium]
MKGSYFKCPWALCFAFVFGQLGLAERQVERPNILFVFGEDWGMDTGAYGNTVVSTPVFDRLACVCHRAFLYSVQGLRAGGADALAFRCFGEPQQ